MILDLKKIINIKNKNDIKSYKIDKPIFNNNYLFHYLILLRNLDGLKLLKFPIYKENNDGLNGFHLAAKEYDFDILCYLIENYSDYIYNKDKYNNSFIYYLPSDKVVKLIKKYQNLDWIDLIENGSSKKNLITKMILSNLNYNDLQIFLDYYNIKLVNNNSLLFNIIHNQNIKCKDKIKLLDNFTNDELNIKTLNNEGIIFGIIDLNNNILINYLLLRDIDLNYYCPQLSYPIYKALYYDIINNIKKDPISIRIYNKIKNDNDFYTQTDKYLDNIAHKILYFRYSNISYTNSSDSNPSLNAIDLIILKDCNDYTWNQENINKISPFDLISRLDYNSYSGIFNNIKIKKKILDRIKKDNINKDWIKLFSSFKEYLKDTNDINIINKINYSHSTLFQSHFTDVGIFCLYLTDKYKSLYLPNMDSYLLHNLYVDNVTGFPFADDMIIQHPIFPWIINYNTSNTYYIHPYLNNLINSHVKDNRTYSHRFACVFLSIITDTYLHANMLIYDFKNKTIERFEPYGKNEPNDKNEPNGKIDSTIDDILEEELTWNTGLKYIRPSEFLPYASFQMISDENNNDYQKAGDFGGFCLAWSIWYLENRLINPDIEQSVLVKKLLNKLNSLDIKFIEYIRNYANKINEARVKYLKKIGIHTNNTSDLNLKHDDDMLLIKYLINKYSNFI
jgi:hypothetical protein